MEEKILKELKELKSILAQLIGTADQPSKLKFSDEALKKAASEFKKLSIERGEWIKEDDIHKVIRKAPWKSGKFIIEKFGFTSYFARGRYLYFNRKDLVALYSELKKRNIDLARYIELERDKEKFRKYLDSLKENKGKKKKLRFIVPEELKDIFTYPYNHPPKEIVEKHILTLKDEYEKFKMAEFVDIYHGTYAMFKEIFYWHKYKDPEVMKRCKSWCNQFNYANEALKMIKNVRSEIIY